MVVMRVTVVVAVVARRCWYGWSSDDDGIDDGFGADEDECGGSCGRVMRLEWLEMGWPDVDRKKRGVGRWRRGGCVKLL
nr:hypothetical protein [Tanacetum cinerariifolium]